MAQKIERRANGKAIKWAAKCPNTRELTLFGHLDLPPIEDYLKPWRLTPLVDQGKAGVYVVVGDLRWMGVNFQELSITLALDPQHARTDHTPVFLLQAYNSNGFFSWSERVFFKAPYQKAQTTIQTPWPLGFSLGGGGRFEAKAGAARDPIEGISLDLEPVVYLPSGAEQNPRVFYARLRGEGKAWPWDKAQDQLSITPGKGDSALDLLKAANFAPQWWALREDALHQKPKTYRESP